MLPVKPDAVASPAPYEIVLGDTDRCPPQGKVMEYSVTVADSRLLINVGGAFSANKAIDFLCENVFQGQPVTLDVGTHYQKSLLSKKYPITQGADARILSANVLADAFSGGEFPSAANRGEILAGILVAYTPDVIGLQEADESWDKVLDSYLAKVQLTTGITYSRLLPSYEDKINYTSLIYRSDKYQVSQSGVTPFTWWSDPAFSHTYHMRNISWASFTPTDGSGKDFIVANTHWSYRTEHSGKNIFLAGSAQPIAENTLRQQCREETDSFMNQLRLRYPNIPIFLTGDFNTSLSFFTQSGWTPSGYSIVSQEALANNSALATVAQSGHFDHIFAAGSYSISCYGHIKDTEHLELITDHPFVYADFSF